MNSPGPTCSRLGPHGTGSYSEPLQSCTEVEGAQKPGLVVLTRNIPFLEGPQAGLVGPYPCLPGLPLPWVPPAPKELPETCSHPRSEASQGAGGAREQDICSPRAYRWAAPGPGVHGMASRDSGPWDWLLASKARSALGQGQAWEGPRAERPLWMGKPGVSWRGEGPLHVADSHPACCLPTRHLIKSSPRGLLRVLFPPRLSLHGASAGCLAWLLCSLPGCSQVLLSPLSTC